jgi:hypothetical protein
MNKRLTAFGCRSKVKAFVLLPIILFLVISVSGCTGLESIPFLSSFCIPGLTCTQVVQYENDILVISTLDAIPSTISTGQQFRLSAWIENRGAETVPQTSEGITQKVTIKLYDTCEGLFKPIEVTCPNVQATARTECQIDSILPKQKVPIFWTLTAYDKDKIPLETSCNLKVLVQYRYRTKSITSISFIDYTEMQRQMNENKFTPITSYITEGYGPIKPYLTVEDQQPIPLGSPGSSSNPTFSMAFQIKNQGSGFLSKAADETSPSVVIKQGDIAITQNTQFLSDNIDTLIKNKIPQSGLTFIGKETPKYTFATKTPDRGKVEKIATYYVTTRVDYSYEFRKEIKVTIKPPAITS